MLLLRKILIPLFFIINSVFTLEVTENTVDRGTISLNVGDVTIKPGAYWAIINNAVSAFVGKLDVQQGAGLYIASTSPLIALQVTLTSLLNTINNDGIIVFDSRASLTAATYNLVGLSFTNTGSMFLAGSGILPSTMALTAASWTNSGLIVFSQNQRNSGNVELGAALGTITNDGQICLVNEVYAQKTRINGNGCITATQDSTIYISNSILSIANTQSFYLADSRSSIVAQAVSGTQIFNVYGFGNGNKIGMTLPLLGYAFPSLPAVDYKTGTGTLTLRNLLVTQQFNIGPGYDPALFKIVTDDGAGIPSTVLGSVQYNGPVPARALPAACQIECRQIPDSP
ncbi:hypothetical protein G210_1869, partial [Candida maltosa Xu316]